MPAKQQWTVRVVVYRSNPTGIPELSRNAASRREVRDAQYEYLGLWIEQLSRMGFARELASLDGALATERVVLEFGPAPHGYDSRAWAENNAARIRSFGLNAVAAPRWDNTKPVSELASAPRG
jgi:hypothetical protein